jgi:hypothetical protein
MCIEYILLPIFLIISIICIIISYKGRKKWKIIEEAKNEELKDIFKERWDKEEKEFNLKKQKLDTAINGYKALLVEKEKRYEEVNQDLDLYRKGKIEEIDSAGAEYEKRKQLIIDKGIEEYRALTNDFFGAELDLKNQQLEQLNKDLDITRNILEIERSKRDAINEEILRQRKIAEEQDFYKIHFTEADKKDIEILRPIAPRLQHPEVINKIIWSSYYQKPLAELRKRLLPNGDISGIYKITRIKTKEIYIGQSTSIDRRFQDHVKTALGVGTLANSQFHRVMSEDGPENFYFEILEEVEKDKLRERESYYISWFKSDKFGLNTLSGDKK